jgi:hypothetical protein
MAGGNRRYFPKPRSLFALFWMLILLANYFQWEGKAYLKHKNEPQWDKGFLFFPKTGFQREKTSRKMSSPTVSYSR